MSAILEFFTKIQFYSHKILKNGPICTKLVSMIKFFHAEKFEKKNQNGRHLKFSNLANQLFLVRKKAKNGSICTKLVPMIKFFHAGKFKKNQNGHHLKFLIQSICSF